MNSSCKLKREAIYHEGSYLYIYLPPVLRVPSSGAFFEYLLPSSAFCILRVDSIEPSLIGRVTGLLACRSKQTDKVKNGQQVIDEARQSQAVGRSPSQFDYKI